MRRPFLALLAVIACTHTTEIGGVVTTLSVTPTNSMYVGDSVLVTTVVTNLGDTPIRLILPTCFVFTVADSAGQNVGPGCAATLSLDSFQLQPGAQRAWTQQWHGERSYGSAARDSFNFGVGRYVLQAGFSRVDEPA